MRITLESWLAHYRFSRFPFDRPEAGNEEFARPEFLAACFVEPPNFERLLGQPDAPVSALLFAERGSGKTACRVMADYYFSTGSYHPRPFSKAEETPRWYVLSIPHIHLQEVMQICQDQSPRSNPLHPGLNHHAEEILRRAVQALTRLLQHERAILHRVDALNPDQRQELTWLLGRYGHYLFPDQVSFLNQSGLYPYESYLSSRQLPIWQRSWIKTRQKVSTTENLARWAGMMPLLKIECSYILVDGLDEFTETADDPQAAYQFIRPLLTNLSLMDSTPHLALKFFLTDRLEELVYRDPKVRKDRGFIFLSLKWKDQQLFEMLDRRLTALAEDSDQGQTILEMHFEELCSPELHGTIKQQVVDLAGCNPRLLFVLCGLMVTAHLDRELPGDQDPYQLSAEDLEAARQTMAARQRPSSLNFSGGLRLDVLALIAQGECETVEFKSSLRYVYGERKDKEKNKWQMVVEKSPYKREEPEAYKGAAEPPAPEAVEKKETSPYNAAILEPQIARAIAGLMNRGGGFVLIGVSDKKEIRGIENDYGSFRDQNQDGFQQALIDVVKRYLGKEYMPYLQFHFVPVEGKTICAIAIERSSSPVFMHTAKGDEFYVRMASTTQKLELPEAVNYIRSNWR